MNREHGAKVRSGVRTGDGRGVGTIRIVIIITIITLASLMAALAASASLSSCESCKGEKRIE
jgi:hypothetical protein